MKNQFSDINQQTGHQTYIRDENGSMMLIVLMVLALMSIIGIASTNTSITENFIVRNTAIRKQNLHMVDTVAAEVFQIVSDITYSDPADPTAFLFPDQLKPEMPDHFDWVQDKDMWKASGTLADWYDPDFEGRILVTQVGVVPANSAVPTSIADNDIEDSTLSLINDRGEYNGDPNNSPIRYALVGWDFISEGENIVVNDPGLLPKKKANLLVEYVSENFGVVRLIVGVEKRI